MFIKWLGFMGLSILLVLYLAAMLVLRLAAEVESVVHGPAGG